MGLLHQFRVNSLPDPAGIHQGSPTNSAKYPRPPTPPSPEEVAGAQTESNIETAIANAQLNRVNQNTPYGSVNFTQTPGPGGIPIYTQNVTESPEEQQLREQRQGLASGLNELGLDQVSVLDQILGTRFDPSQTAGSSGFSSTAAGGGPLDLAGALGAYDASRFDPATLGDFSGDIEARQRELLSRGLDRQFDRSEEKLRTRLANQGFETGSEGFNEELRAFNEGKGDAYARAELAARDTARQDRAQALGELLSGFDVYSGARGQELSELMGERQQQIGEAESDWSRDYAAGLAERQIPLSEIASLISNNPLTTLNPGAVATAHVDPTNIAGIQQTGFANAMQQYQQQQQQRNAIMGAGASALAAIFASDERLKRDIEYVGTDERGLDWYDFRFVDEDDDAPLSRGVIAQDLLKTPYADRVGIGENGFLEVDYGSL